MKEDGKSRERDEKVKLYSHDDMTNLKDVKDALSLIKQGPEKVQSCRGTNVFGEAEEKHCW